METSRFQEENVESEIGEVGGEATEVRAEEVEREVDERIYAICVFEA